MSSPWKSLLVVFYGVVAPLLLSTCVCDDQQQPVVATTAAANTTTRVGNATLLYVAFDDFDSVFTSKMSREEWYLRCKLYWQLQPATLATMVLGYDDGSINPSDVDGFNRLDLQESLDFLHEFFPDVGKPKRRALDLGAGMARAAKDVFLYLASAVDVVEQDRRLLWEALRRLHGYNRYGYYVLGSVTNYSFSEALDKNGKKADGHPQSEDGGDPKAAYDLVSLVWVSSSLLDEELLQVLKRHHSMLTPNGILFLKDVILASPNTTTTAAAVGEDSPQLSQILVEDTWADIASLTNLTTTPSSELLPVSFQRSDAHHRHLFHAAGFTVVKVELLPPWHSAQTSGMVMYALSPAALTAIPTPDGNDPYVVSGWDLYEGIHYPSLEAMWQQAEEKMHWNDHNKEYWETREAKVNNPEIAERDIVESVQFLAQLFDPRTRFQRKALDVGAGVGRVAQAVLLKFVYTVDLVDQGRHFLIEAKNRLFPVNPKGKYIHSSAQAYAPDVPHSYDLICLQYTALYLNDNDLLAVLKTLKLALKNDPDSILFVKESISKDDHKFQINHDSGYSIVRTWAHFRWLLSQAGWKVALQAAQQDWVPDANPVWMFALKPVELELQEKSKNLTDEL